MNWLKQFWTYFDAVQETYRLILAVLISLPFYFGVVLCSLGYFILGIIAMIFTIVMILSRVLLK